MALVSFLVSGFSCFCSASPYNVEKLFSESAAPFHWQCVVLWLLLGSAPAMVLNQQPLLMALCHCPEVPPAALHKELCQSSVV